MAVALTHDRIPKIAVAVFVVLPLAFLLFAGLVFYRFLTPAEAKFARFPNPSHTLGAVMVDRRINTTAPDSVLVYVVDAKALVSGRPVVDWVDADGLTVTWSGDNALLGRAERARTDGKDYNEHEDVTVGKTTVRVRYEIGAFENR